MNSSVSSPENSRTRIRIPADLLHVDIMAQSLSQLLLQEKKTEPLIFEATKFPIRFFNFSISSKLTLDKDQSLSVDGTIDAPEYGYTRESTDELYCPDILFREKDEYGNDVTKIGRPLPIEYLLTDVRSRKG